LHDVWITNLRVADGTVDLALRRHAFDVGINVTQKIGEMQVAVQL